MRALHPSATWYLRDSPATHREVPKLVGELGGDVGVDVGVEQLVLAATAKELAICGQRWS